MFRSAKRCAGRTGTDLLDDLKVLRIVPRPSEGQVLHHVCESTLMLVFQHRADLGTQVTALHARPKRKGTDSYIGTELHQRGPFTIPSAPP
jgi:hypothetical protein